MNDFSLPKPLLSPEKWPQVTGSKCVLSLDLAIATGGAIRFYYQDLIRNNEIIWRARASRVRGNDASSIIRREEALKWIKPSHQMYFEDAADLTLTANVYSGSLPSSATTSEWIFEIAGREFPELENYLKEYPEAAVFPFEGFRFFAGYLRQKQKLEDAQEFAKVWAKLQALYSPQDEVVEEDSLLDQDVILNPTLQLVRSLPSEEAYIDLWVRYADTLETLRIGVLEGALIDEVSENFRMPKSTLLKGAAELVSATEHEFEEAYRDLIEASVLLEGRA